MKLLQSWVYTLTETGNCESIICRDLHSILRYIDKSKKTFIHTGFSGLDRLLVAEAMNGIDANVFASASAYFSLKEFIKLEDAVISVINEEPVFCDVIQHNKAMVPDTVLTQKKIPALEKKSTLNFSATIELPMFIQKNSTWIDAYKRSYPDKVGVLDDWSIDNDESYFSLEKRLSFDERLDCGVFRQGFLHTITCESSPPDLLRTCPPWLLEREVSTLNFSVRVANVLEVENICTLMELAALTIIHLLRLPNFGRKSLTDICEVIMKALNEGPFGGADHTQLVLNKPLSSHVIDTLAKVKTREADILTKRMGLGCKSYTLEEIGTEYNLTRERIRQIESKALNKIASSEFWDDVLLNKVEHFQQNQNGPLFLHHLVEIEPWFSGYSNQQHVLKYLIENFCEDKFTVLKYDSLDIISSFPQKELEECLQLVPNLASNAVKQRWTLARFSHELEALFPAKESALAKLVASQWESKFHTVKNEQGILEIISDSRGANGAVLKVLEESNIPLHYSEVHKILTESGYECDIRRVHNALGEMGYVFERGAFGLEKHIRLNADEIKAIIDYTIEIIYSGDSKQWHTNELFDLLSDSLPFGERMTSHIINVILQSNEVELNYLGRNVWCRDDSEHISTADRVDVRQAIISILMDNNGPMSGISIVNTLKQQRGLPRSVQINPGEPLVRVDRGMWGILDRDIIITPNQRADILNSLYSYLNNSSQGISLTHMRNVFGVNQQLLEVGITPDSLYGLCQLDNRFKTAQGELLGLSKWDDVRCLSLKQASRKVLKNNPYGLTIEEVRASVCELMGYKVEDLKVSQGLNHIGMFDAVSQKWFPIDVIDLELNDLN